jgi:hypothetical protein
VVRFPERDRALAIALVSAFLQTPYAGAAWPLGWAGVKIGGCKKSIVERSENGSSGL